MPEPIQPITGTSKRTPVCPYTVYKTLAEELDRQTRRINGIMKGLKLRGIIAADAAAIENLAEADDNELITVGNIENLVAAGGLEKAVMWWPVDKAIAVLQQLYLQREQAKGDLRNHRHFGHHPGQGNAGRNRHGAADQDAMGRASSRRCSGSLNGRFGIFSSSRRKSSAAISLSRRCKAWPVSRSTSRRRRFCKTARSLPDQRRESDSTVRADLTRSRQEMAEFLQGTAQFSRRWPRLSAGPEAAGPLVEMYAAFSRQFNLGKQAEDALEKFATWQRKPLLSRVRTPRPRQSRPKCSRNRPKWG